MTIKILRHLFYIEYILLHKSIVNIQFVRFFQIPLLYRYEKKERVCMKSWELFPPHQKANRLKISSRRQKIKIASLAGLWFCSWLILIYINFVQKFLIFKLYHWWSIFNRKQEFLKLYEKYEFDEILEKFFSHCKLNSQLFLSKVRTPFWKL